jgi:hypothetical protein
MLEPSLIWLDWWRRGAALGWGSLQRLASLPDPGQLRSWWLTDMRHLTADYLKSPAFFALMKVNLALLSQPMIAKAAQMMMTTPAG